MSTISGPWPDSKNEPAKPRLLDRVRDAVRARHYSIRTEEAYTGWIRRFILFHGKRHPSPRIVIQRSLAFSAGRHVLSVVVPGRQFSRTVEFDVGVKQVNLYVMINQGAVEVGVTDGVEPYL